MVDGKAVSYFGREGSGEAQILPGSSFDPVQYAANVTEKINERRIADRDRQIAAADKLQENLDLDYDGWSDLLPELDAKYDALTAYAMRSFKEGVDVTSPDNRQAHSLWNSGKREIEMMGKEGIKLRDAYFTTQEEIAKNPDKYDLDHYNKWHDDVKAAKTLEERTAAMRKPALIPVFNPYDALDLMKAPSLTTKPGDTKYVRADKAAVEGEVDRFMSTKEGEETLMAGVRNGDWKDSKGMRDFYVGELVDSVNRSTIKDKPKEKGSGLEFNFGGGGKASNKNWSFDYKSEVGPVVASGKRQDEVGAMSGFTEKVSIHSTKGENVKPIKLVGEDGEVQSLQPVEFRRVDNGDIYMTAVDQDGNPYYNIPYSTSLSNRLAIEGAYDNFDVEAYMDMNTEKSAPTDDEVENQSADYLASKQDDKADVTRQKEMLENIDWVDNATIEDGVVRVEFDGKYVELDQSKQKDRETIKRIYSGEITSSDFKSESEEGDSIDSLLGKEEWTPE